MLLSQKYEIFPTKEQKETLDRWLQYCRQTYNSALLDKQRKYKENKQLYTRSDMQKQQVIDKSVKEGSFTFLYIFPCFSFIF
ncbi:helix-turn-helix domain-containing protein [Bacillus pseudomycoides]|nr:helix-turn-helix domain-containing protein [Bacillus pseudomycoides]MDF2086999.1 helix-turn-helix domain-containing protein [Bacillus pseudomycoides]